MPGSGKTIASDKAKQLGLHTLTVDEIILEEIQRRGMIRTRKNERRVANYFHENKREMMRRIVDKITNAKNPDKIVIEGLKSVDQVKSLQERLNGDQMHILAIHSPPEIRWSRRQKLIKHKTHENIKQDDKNDIEAGLPELISMADHMVLNNGDLLGFRQTVKDKLIDILNIDVKR